MAKVVIAGRSDCPYFSRVELLGDRLAKTVPSFQVHKITKTPEEWQVWLEEVCAKEGWNHSTSPLIWRELIDRGGKGVLIGGARDFQEYVKGYYSIELAMTSQSMQSIARENCETKKELDAENEFYKSLSKPVSVCITGAESRTSYPVIMAFANGELLGQNTEICLQLLASSDSMDASDVQAFIANIQDLCCGLVRGIEVVHSPRKAFRDCSVIVILDELEMFQGEDLKGYLLRNMELFASYGREINAVATKCVRVLLAGSGPVNFNASKLISHAPNILKQNVVGLSRLVENRARAIIADKLKVLPSVVVDVIVWGNVNSRCFIDTSQARVLGYDGSIWGPPFYPRSAAEMVHDPKWLHTEYLELVAKRSASVQTALKHPAHNSKAHAVITTLDHWLNGSPHGQIVSLAVCSEGWYGVPEGVVFSYPVTMSPKGHWSIVQDIQLTVEMEQELKAAVRDIMEELQIVQPPPAETEEQEVLPKPDDDGKLPKVLQFKLL